MTIVFAIAVYGVSLPASHVLPVIVTIALAAFVFCALGVAVSSAIPNVDSGPAIINLPFFVMVFISGTYFPISGGLATVAAWLPLRPFIVALYYHAFNPLTAHGSGWAPHQLESLAIWGIVADVLRGAHVPLDPAAVLAVDHRNRKPLVAGSTLVARAR